MMRSGQADTICATLIAVFVAGCASRGAVSPLPVSVAALSAAFECGDVRIETQFDAGAVRLTLDGRSYELLRSRAASGARFASQPGQRAIVFWTKGDEALLEVDGKPMPTCHASDAHGLSLPFVGRGNEPGWVLRLTSNAIELAYNYGSDRIAAPLPQAQTREGGVRFVVDSDAGVFEVDIRHRVCRDSMSGMPHPSEVVLTLAGAEFHGCGGDPAALLVGQRWTVEQIDDRPLDADAVVTVEFGADGRVAGSSGCNRYTGSLQLTGEGLTVGTLATTRRACPPPLMALEGEVLAVVQGVQRFDFDDSGALMLHAAGNRSLRARRGAK